MALEANQISFRYGPRFAIGPVSMRATSGRVTGIIGANGSGKTTLLKLLGGLLASDEGTVLLDGKELSRIPPSNRARHLAYVPQSHEPAFDFSVEQMVLLGRIPWRGRFGGFENDGDVRSAAEAIELMDLTELRHEPVTQLSGGELQRVLIARAIAQQATTLLLDEPTSHLDVAHQQRVLDVLRQRARTHALAVVASIHDLNLASIYSDRIVALSDGCLAAEGTPSEVLRPDTLEVLYRTRLHVEPDVYGSSPSIRPIDTAGDAAAAAAGRSDAGEVGDA